MHRYILCIYGIFGKEITIHTVIYGVYVRFWPTLIITLPHVCAHCLCACIMLLRFVSVRAGRLMCTHPLLACLHYTVFCLYMCWQACAYALTALFDFVNHHAPHNPSCPHNPHAPTTLHARTSGCDSIFPGQLTKQLGLPATQSN